MKNNVYPCKSQFYYIKVGFKGVNIIKVCFRDDYRCMICFLQISLIGSLGCYVTEYVFLRIKILFILPQQSCFQTVCLKLVETNHSKLKFQQDNTPVHLMHLSVYFVEFFICL